MTVRALITAVLCGSLAACATLGARSTTGPGCPVVEPDDGHEPLYAVARELLADSSSNGLREDIGLRGTPAEVTWLADDIVCNQLRRALKRGDDDPALAAVRVGNRILVEVRPGGHRYLADGSGKILLGFVVPD